MNTSYSDKRRVKLTNALKSALLFVLIATSQYAKATTTTAIAMEGYIYGFPIVLMDETRKGMTGPERSYTFGAHGFIPKPVNPETFIDRINRILDDRIDMKFWGVRGTLPVSGDKSLKYGGNTSCMTLEFPREQFFIFDCGSGIKNLGDSLVAQKRKDIHAKIFISHPHWDHINAIPFFSPLYMQGNDFEVLGANQSDITMREMVSAQRGE